MALGVLAPATVFGQAPAPASETFEPQAVAGTSIWSTATSDIAPHLTPSLNLVGHYARNPVQLQNRDNSETAARLLKDQLKLDVGLRSEEHTSELQSRPHLVCRLLLEKK